MPPTPPPWPRPRRSSPTTTRSRCSTPRRSWISVHGITGSRAGESRTRKAPRSCPHWSGCSPRTPIIPARSTITFMPWKPRTVLAAPNPTPTGCAAPFLAPAISFTCRATSTTGSGVTADNTTAAAVDEKYLTASDAPMGGVAVGYYPHNVHFVMASALMAGDGANSIAAAEKLHGLVPDAEALAIPGTHPAKAAPYYAHALFSSPDAILALPDPGNSIPYVKAMWHYARGVAYAARRDSVAGKAEANAIDTIERTADFSLLKTAGIPASEVLQLARTVVEGRLAQAEGDSNKAIERFEQAATLQDALPYTEPPYWYYPVRQSLAAALMQAGRLPEAEGQFQRALRKTPHNGWSYYGLAELYRSTGDSESAKEAEANLAKTWIGNRELMSLSRL